MPTKEQLERWRSQGFEFDAFYDEISERQEKEQEKIKESEKNLKELTEKKVYIHKLIEVKEILLNKDYLGKFLFELPQNKSSYLFEINPISGWIYYSNFDELRRNKVPYQLPKTEGEVIKHIQNYIKSIGENFKKTPKIKDINPFPDYLEIAKPVQIVPVINAATETIDHWLCKYQVSIMGSNGLLPLLNSSVEFRIGNKGKVIGCSLQYRKIIGHMSTELIPYVHESHTNEHEHTEEEEEEETEALLCYNLGGETEHQNYLTPFYMTPNGHHSNFVAASKYSMVPTIYEIHNEDGAQLLAFPNGGSGNYSYEWSSWQIEDWDSSFNDLGLSNTCNVGIGVYNVILTIIDKGDPKNEIIAQTQQTVYSFGESNEVSLNNNQQTLT